MDTNIPNQDNETESQHDDGHEPSGFSAPQTQASAFNGAASVSGETNTKALVSFVSSLSTLILFWLIPLVGIATSILSLVTGLKSLKETKNPNTSRGRGLAIAGVVCGCAALILSVVWSCLMAVLLFAVIMGGTTAP